jgi:hypothetical protein
MKESRPIYVFWHVATMGNWREVVEEQANLLTSSGLASIAKIHVCKVGPESWTIPQGMHLALDYPFLDYYEFPTLKLIHEYSQNTNFDCLYFHTKGVSKTPEHWEKHKDHYLGKLRLNNYEELCKHEREWRHYMQYFLIGKHKKALEALKLNDLVGVSWRPEPIPHFSGNFWWARSDYLMRLSDPYRLWWITDNLGTHRAGAEFWVASETPRIRALFNAHQNLYTWGIPKYSYMDVLM